ncbi:MAG: hypothetical protein E6346_09105 [Lactococcus lactis]|nr:hypothetical protein [Lactococcus lactis]
MKQFHYEEVTNLERSNLFQKVIELGVGWLLFVSIAILLISATLVIAILIKRRNKPQSSKNTLLIISTVIIFITSMLLLAIFIWASERSSIGYYQAQGKVINIDKQEKVKDKTHYKIKVRFINGNIEDKKTQPFTITTTNRDGLKNGDKAIITTPKMEFKGHEDKQVKLNDLLASLFISSSDEESSDEESKVPHLVMKDEFQIHKD